MSTAISLEELYGLESWAKENAECSPHFEVVIKASTALRDLMSQNLSQKNLLKYLHQRAPQQAA